MLVWGWLIDSWRNGCWCCAERKACKIHSLGLPVEFWQRQANVSQMSKWTKSTISDFWTQRSSGGSLCPRLMPWHAGHKKCSIWTQIAVSCFFQLGWTFDSPLMQLYPFAFGQFHPCNFQPCLGISLGMILMTCPTLAGDGVLFGLRGEAR